MRVSSVEWDGGFYHRSFSSFAFYLETAMKLLRSLTHSGQAESLTFGESVLTHPRPIIHYLQAQRPGFITEADDDLLRLRMSHCIGDRFLADAQQIEFRFRRQRARGAAQPDLNRNLQTGSRLSPDALQGLSQIRLIERLGTQRPHRTPRLV